MPKTKPHKRPTFGVHVEASRKKPRLGGDPSEAGRSHPTWRVGSVDWEGPFGWGRLTEPELAKELWQRLRDLESMSWTDIEKAGSHNVAADRLCADARRRLEELQQDDVEDLFSLRITGRRRAWGFREANVLRLLWWDPEHQVCPSTLANT